MPLSAPAARQHGHTRRMTFQGFRRDDGLWDVEGELVDTKPRDHPTTEKGVLPADTPIHHMRARITVDARLTVVAIEAALESTPFPECGGALAHLQRLVGMRAGGGWRQAIDGAMGRTQGCEHLRELLAHLAIVAYQTLAGTRRLSADGQPVQLTAPLPHMGRCMAWDFGGGVIARHYPQFRGWRGSQG